MEKTGRAARTAATSPKESAPRAAAPVPSQVTPPDVPAGTGLLLVIRRGWRLLNTPISVAHVSAVAVASAAAYTLKTTAVLPKGASKAIKAATPPFAST